MSAVYDKVLVVALLDGGRVMGTFVKQAGSTIVALNSAGYEVSFYSYAVGVFEAEVRLGRTPTRLALTGPGGTPRGRDLLRVETPSPSFAEPCPCGCLSAKGCCVA